MGLENLSDAGFIQEKQGRLCGCTYIDESSTCLVQQGCVQVI